MSKALRIDPERYADWRTKDVFNSCNPKLRNGYLVFDATVGEDEGIIVRISAPSGTATQDMFRLAEQVIQHLTAFDHIVQQVAASQCESSGLASYNFESELASISIDPDSITFLYFGAAVNTEWDEVFRLSEGGWVHERAGLGAGSGAIVRFVA